MRKDTQAAHVQLPDDVGCSLVLEELFPIRTIVFTIAKTLCVEAPEWALRRDIVQPVTFHIRCACSRRQQELSQASLHSRGHVLPKKLAIGGPKGHEHAAIFLVVGVHVSGVVSAYI